MHLVEVTPAPCLNCGTGNVPTNDGSPRRFVDLERDTHWDDPAILCEDCIMQLGGMIGMLSMDALNEYKHQLGRKDKEIHDLQAEIGSMKRRARKAGLQFIPAEAK